MNICAERGGSITVLLKCIYFPFSAIYWDMNGFSVIKQGLKPPIPTQICPLAWWWRWRKYRDNSTRYFRLPSIIFYSVKPWYSTNQKGVWRCNYAPTCEPHTHTHTENGHSYVAFLQWRLRYNSIYGSGAGWWVSLALTRVGESHPGQNQHFGSNQTSHVFLQSSEKRESTESQRWMKNKAPVPN